MRRWLTRYLIVLIAGIVSTAYADEAGERAALSHLVHTMEALTPWIEAAEAQVAPEIRSSRYACLRGDLTSMCQGIETHLNGPRNIPTQPSPLCLDYFGLSSRPGVVLAEGELEPLARLAQALRALEPLIAAAESEAGAGARIRFRYAWLRQDLIRMRAGIMRLVNTPRTVPRAFPPLTGDDRRSALVDSSDE
jgi:RAQPRD family integrative conjugative element protein